MIMLAYLCWRNMELQWIVNDMSFLRRLFTYMFGSIKQQNESATLPFYRKNHNLREGCSFVSEIAQKGNFLPFWLFKDQEHKSYKQELFIKVYKAIMTFARKLKKQRIKYF